MFCSVYFSLVFLLFPALVAAGPSLSLVVPEKREFFFLPTVTKCMLTLAGLIVRVSSNSVGSLPHSMKSIEVSAVMK